MPKILSVPHNPGSLLECNLYRLKTQESYKYSVLEHPCLDQLNAQPQVLVVPADHWPDRFIVKIEQAGCCWELCPSLTLAEAKTLLKVLEREGIDLDLDLNEGSPLQVAQIHQFTEKVIGGLR